MLDPTEEQSSILSAIRDGSVNLAVNALAGTGKTTTLELIEHASKVRPILYLAFNKKIADEAKERMLSTTSVRTFNSLGHRIWAQAQGGHNLRLDPKKTQVLLRAFIDEIPKSDREAIWASFWEVTHAVGLAKGLGYVPEGKFPNAKRLISQGDFHRRLDESPDDLTADLIDAILTRSINAAFKGNIDYNDQVYMPAIFGGTFPRFPFVLVDEAQDLNPVNHALLDKLVKQRVVLVGDRFQSIYAFRGAVQAGMETLAEKFSAEAKELTVSFRCPEKVVENARWRVPNFQWTKPGGHVEILTELLPSSIRDNAAIICRNNAPLFSCALNLLAVGRSVSVAGSDIGPRVIGIMKKLGPESMSREMALGAIGDWLAQKEDKGSSSAADIAACMKVFVSVGSDLSQAIRYAEHVLAQKGAIRLMTGHKAKGLEFDTVYHLDPWLCREEEQDLNLRYVIQTRAKETYFEINSAGIKWA